MTILTYSVRQRPALCIFSPQEFELVVNVRSVLEKVTLKLISEGVTIWVKREEKHIIARGKTIKKQINPRSPCKNELFGKRCLYLNSNRKLHKGWGGPVGKPGHMICQSDFRWKRPCWLEHKIRNWRDFRGFRQTHWVCQSRWEMVPWTRRRETDRLRII